MMQGLRELVGSGRLSPLVLAVSLVLASSIVAAAPPTAEVSTTAAVFAQEESGPTSIWPDLSPVNAGWLAAVAVLLLTFRARPLWSSRNLDALVLAVMCLMVPFRHIEGRPAGSDYGWNWWSYAVLTAALVYWLLRGAVLTVGVRAMPHPGTVSGGARAVLVIVGLAIVIQQLIAAPLAPASRDGIVGGLYTSETGQLPYGEVPGYDTRSPLLYYLHAGAIRLAPPTFVELQNGGAPRELRWAQRADWIDKPLLELGDFPAARLVNGALFLLTLLAVYFTGQKLGVEGGAWLMVALFCLFPGTRESAARPEVMLPVALLAWTLCCALLGGMGGLFATLFLILAATSWPWAWLGLPVLVAFLWRRGWQAFNSTVGLVAGLVGIVAGLLYLVQPCPPRANGALGRAGIAPSYSARYVDPSTIVVEPIRQAPETTPPVPASAFLWRWLVNPDARPLKRVGGTAPDVTFEWPPDVADNEVEYERVALTPEASARLALSYRAGLSNEPPVQRAAAALRTVLEPTWLRVSALEPEQPGAWETWGGQPLPTYWVQVRRIARVVLLLVVLWAALAVFLGKRTHPRHVLGGLLLTFAGAITVSTPGVAANPVLLVPLIAASWSLVQPPAPGGARVSPPGPTLPSALDRLRSARPAPNPGAPLPTPVTTPTPRITIETTPPAAERKD